MHASWPRARLWPISNEPGASKKVVCPSLAGRRRRLTRKRWINSARQFASGIPGLSKTLATQSTFSTMTADRGKDVKEEKVGQGTFEDVPCLRIVLGLLFLGSCLRRRLG